MFQCGDYVMYGTHGACQIVSVETRQVDRKNIEYFVLTPVFQLQSKFYIPTNNEAALSKLHPVLSQYQVEQLLLKYKNAHIDWNTNEPQRRLQYKDLLLRGDRDALLAMIISVSDHQRTMEAIGKRIHACDESFLKDAKKLINTEFALVLQIPIDEVETYVRNILTA